MAVAIDPSSAVSGGGNVITTSSASTSFSHIGTSGATPVLAIAVNAGTAGVTTATYNGSSMTNLTAEYQNNSVFSGQTIIFGGPVGACTGSTVTVALTFTGGNASSAEIYVVSYTGVASFGTPPTPIFGDNGSTTAESIIVAATVTGYGVCAFGTAGTAPTSPNQNSEYSAGTGSQALLMMDAAGAASITFTATPANFQNYSIVAVPLVGAAAPAGDPTAGAQLVVLPSSPLVGPMALRSLRRWPTQPVAPATQFVTVAGIPSSEAPGALAGITKSDPTAGAQLVVQPANQYVGPQALRRLQRRWPSPPSAQPPVTPFGALIAKLSNGQNATLATIGDSTTYGLGMGQSAPAQPWPAQLGVFIGQALNATVVYYLYAGVGGGAGLWSAGSTMYTGSGSPPTLSIYNGGISGAGLSTFTTDMQNSGLIPGGPGTLSALPLPDVMMLGDGINDLSVAGTAPATWVSQYQTFLTNLQAIIGTVPIVVTTQAPVNQSAETPVGNLAAGMTALISTFTGGTTPLTPPLQAAAGYTNVWVLDTMQSFDNYVSGAAAASPWGTYVPLLMNGFASGSAGTDNFHPGVQGYTVEATFDFDQLYPGATLNAGFGVPPYGPPSGEAFGAVTVTQGAAPTDPTSGAQIVVNTANPMVGPMAMRVVTRWPTPPMAQAIGQTISPAGFADIPGADTGAEVGFVALTQFVAPGGIPPAEAFGGPLSTQVVALAGIPSGEAPGYQAATQLAGPAGVPSSEALGAITATQVITLAGIPGAESVGAPTGLLYDRTAGAQLVTIVPNPAVGPVALRQNRRWPTPAAAPPPPAGPLQTVTPAGFADIPAVDTGSEFGAPTLGWMVDPAGIPSSEAFGAQQGTVFLTPAGIPSGEAPGFTAATQIVAPGGIPPAEVPGYTSAGLNVVAAGIPGAEVLGAAATAAAGTAVTIAGIAGLEAFGMPAAALSVAVAGIQPAETLGAPVSLVYDPTAGAQIVVNTANPMVGPQALRQQTRWPQTPTFVQPAGPAQFVTVTGFADIPGVDTGADVGAITVGWSINPGGIPSAETLGAPAATQNVVAAGIPPLERAGSSVVTIYLTPAGIPGAEAAGSPVTTPGTAFVAPGGILPAEVFGALPAPALSVAPGGIPGAEVFGVPITTINVTPYGIGPLGIFGNAAAVPGTVTITPAGILGGEAFGMPLLPITLQPWGIPPGEAFGAPAGTIYATPGGIPPAEASGAPTVGLIILGAGIGPLERAGTAAVGMNVVLPGIPPGEAVGAAGIAPVITPGGITPGEAFGAQQGTIFVAATGVPPIVGVGSPQFAQLIITAAGIPSAEAAGRANAWAPPVGRIIIVPAQQRTVTVPDMNRTVNVPIEG